MVTPEAFYAALEHPEPPDDEEEKIICYEEV